MSRFALTLLFALTALCLLALGLSMAQWWTIAGGVAASAAAAWLATEDR